MMKPKEAPALTETMIVKTKGRSLHAMSHMRPPHPTAKTTRGISTFDQNAANGGGVTSKPSRHSTRYSGGAAVYFPTPLWAKSFNMYSIFSSRVMAFGRADPSQQRWSAAHEAGPRCRIFELARISQGALNYEQRKAAGAIMRYGSHSPE